MFCLMFSDLLGLKYKQARAVYVLLLRNLFVITAVSASVSINICVP